MTTASSSSRIYHHINHSFCRAQADAAMPVRRSAATAAAPRAQEKRAGRTCQEVHHRPSSFPHSIAAAALAISTLHRGAMLRLRRSLLSQILSSPFASPICHLSRFISAAAPAVSRNPRFAVEEYLVSTCGLTRPQALKASPKLSHLKSPTKPDAVLAFLAGLGLSPADVAAVVAKDPKFLCASVEKTLAPVVAGLTGLGLSRSQIARLVSLIGVTFRCRSIIAGLQYCLPLFGSSENLLRALPLAGGSVLGSDLERVVKPNVSFLLECGLGACDIAKLYAYTPSPLSISTERIRTAVACVDSLGVHRGSPMFRHALQAVAFLSEEKITAKVEHLKKAFRWSDAEVGIAVSKAPTVLTRASRGCATLPLVPPCRSRWSAVVCNASVYIIPLMKQCVSVAAAA
ncbi:hypothetical protein TRIUR3_28036 [Triticum urartu]|uniref:mTERF domain-containing protein 1, mitochondrial n=1 Tax=Triticum urartu TaxID=4572 RepID=M7YUX2_TRIUA|nr:hypothetical protein TRIUR3_28036 [Triticum urartu]